MPLVYVQNHVAASTGGGDPNIDQVTLLMHMNGDNNSTIFGDIRGHTVTRGGNAIISTAQSKFGGAALYAPTGSDYVSVTADAGFLLPADYTIEFWFYAPNLPSNYGELIGNMVSNSTDQWTFELSAGGVINYYVAGFGNLINSSVTASAATWTHVAATRSGTTVRLFVNGQVSGTVELSGTLGSDTRPIYIGGRSNSPGTSTLYIDDVRITKGFARYTDAFAPPSVQHPDPSFADFYYDYVTLLMSMNTTLTDEKNHKVVVNGDVTIANSPVKFGNGAAFFNSTQPLLTILKPDDSPSPDFTFGTADYTIEAWIRPTAYPSGQAPVWTNSPASGTGYRSTTHGVNLMSGGNLRVQSAYDVFLTGGITIPLNQWTHVALTRSGTTMRLFVNGALDASASNSNNFSEVIDFKLGGYQTTADGQHYNGYIDDVRVTKGIARYTSAFVPPQLQFPAVGTDQYLANVKFLGHMNGTVGGTTTTELLGSNAKFFGNSVLSSTAKFGTTSISNPDTSSGVAFTPTGGVSYEIGANDFTLEAWVNRTQATFGSIAGTYRWYFGYHGGYSLMLDANGAIIFYISSTVVVQSPNGVVPALNQWFHIAVTRAGSTWRFFVDGALVHTATDATALVAVDSSSGSDVTGYDYPPDMKIGYRPSDGSRVQQFIGYIDDVRLTVGVARYAAAFTPPPASFPDE